MVGLPALHHPDCDRCVGTAQIHEPARRKGTDQGEKGKGTPDERAADGVPPGRGEEGEGTRQAALKAAGGGAEAQVERAFGLGDEPGAQERYAASHRPEHGTALGERQTRRDQGPSGEKNRRHTQGDKDAHERRRQLEQV